MEITAEQRGNVTVVVVTGTIDALTAAEVTAFLEGKVNRGETSLVADIGGVDYVSSSGLRSFLAAVKAARQAGGDLRLARVQENVRKVLEMTGFTSILKSYPDVEAAVASFSR